jgi:hypothetical protein
MAVAISRQWVVELLHRMGRHEEADEASRVLPDPMEPGELEAFGSRHGISHDEVTSWMGGSP